MIPRSFIQDLLTRVDIVEVIERHMSLKKSGANYFGCCPFHGEKTPSFSVSPSKQFYHCFGCGVNGSAISFLMEYAGLSFVDAVRELASEVGLVVPDETPDRQEHHTDKAYAQTLSQALEAASRFYKTQLKQNPHAISYLKQRGLTGEIAAKYGLGYAPDAWQALEQVFADYQAPTLLEAGLVIENEQGRRYDRFRGRVMFPIHDARGNIIAFGGRVIGTGEPKYLNSPETPLFEKGRELYGLHQARVALRETGYAIVVEGYMDVVALAQFGIQNAVATLGTATTPIHVQKLLRQTQRIVFCFDGDHAGQKAASRALDNALEHIPDGKTLQFLFLPPDDDPDSFVRREGTDAFIQLTHTAPSAAEYLISELKGNADLHHPEGKSKLIHDAKPYLQRIQAPLLRLQIIKELAALSGFTQHEIEITCQLKATNLRANISQPTKALRRPSMTTAKERTLLLMALHAPQLIGRIPHALLPVDSQHPETRLLIGLIDAFELGELNTSSCARILEHFRGSEHEQTLSDLIPLLDEEYFDDSTLEQTFEDTISSFVKARQAEEFAQLQEKLTRSNLSHDELIRYRELLALKKPQQTEN